MLIHLIILLQLERNNKIHFVQGHVIIDLNIKIPMIILFIIMGILNI